MDLCWHSHTQFTHVLLWLAPWTSLWPKVPLISGTDIHPLGPWQLLPPPTCGLPAITVPDAERQVRVPHLEKSRKESRKESSNETGQSVQIRCRAWTNRFTDQQTIYTQHPLPSLFSHYSSSSNHLDSSLFSPLIPALIPLFNFP